MRQGLDISDVEEKTRIRSKYLRALENEEWTSLPGETYVERFLKTYADSLGLDSDRIVDEHRRQTAETPRSEAVKSLQRKSSDSAKRRHSRSIPAGAATVGALVIIFGLLFAVGLLSGEDKNDVTQVQVTTTVKEQSPRSATKKELSADKRSSNNLVSLKIEPQTKLWVCLIDYNGKELIPGAVVPIAQASKKYRSKRFLLTLGNGQAEISVDGKKQDVPDSANPIGYRITKKGISRLTKAERPTCS